MKEDKRQTLRGKEVSLNVLNREESPWAAKNEQSSVSGCETIADWLFVHLKCIFLMQQWRRLNDSHSQREGMAFGVDAGEGGGGGDRWDCLWVASRPGDMHSVYQGRAEDERERGGGGGGGGGGGRRQEPIIANKEDKGVVKRLPPTPKRLKMG